MTHTVIFGGTKGLGKVVAMDLKKRGDKISIFSRTLPPANEQIRGCKYYAVDVSATLDVLLALKDAISLFGQLNYLIFCQRYRGNLEPWIGEMDVSVSAPKLIIEAMQEHFSTDKECGITFVSSVFGDRIGDGQDISYHISKSAVNHMARYFAVKLGRKGIRVNSITPCTYLKEESNDYYLKNKRLMDLYKEIIPLGRMGTAEDSSDLIQFLCSPSAKFINGQNIYVDGGLSLVWPESLARHLTSI
jgi:NAD(P)-dependent dehydrogenase (short-subunit alcohol dehydrogenase family)